jgi:hypothetical protein
MGTFLGPNNLNTGLISAYSFKRMEQTMYGLIHEDDDDDDDYGDNLNTLGGETLWTGASYIGCTAFGN